MSDDSLSAAPGEAAITGQAEQQGGEGRRSGRRARGGSESRRAARRGSSREQLGQILRKIPCFEVMNEEALETIEHNADSVLEEIGLEFRDDPEVLQLWKDAGCDVQGERIRFPRGLCRRIVQDNAPRTFTQHARNAARSVQIGGDVTVFAP